VLCDVSWAVLMLRFRQTPNAVGISAPSSNAIESSSGVQPFPMCDRTSALSPMTERGLGGALQSAITGAPTGRMDATERGLEQRLVCELERERQRVLSSGPRFDFSSSGRPPCVASPRRSAAHSIVSHRAEVRRDVLLSSELLPSLSTVGLATRTRFLLVMSMLSMVLAVGLIVRLPHRVAERRSPPRLKTMSDCGPVWMLMQKVPFSLDERVGFN
jgi:hypothetical protein